MIALAVAVSRVLNMGGEAARPALAFARISTATTLRSGRFSGFVARAAAPAGWRARPRDHGRQSCSGWAILAYDLDMLAVRTR